MLKYLSMFAMCENTYQVETFVNLLYLISYTCLNTVNYALQ